MPLPIVEQVMYRENYTDPIRHGFTLLEHFYDHQNRAVMLTHEQVILHLVARMSHLDDGPRRISELRDTLDAKVIEFTKIRMNQP